MRSEKAQMQNYIQCFEKKLFGKSTILDCRKGKVDPLTMCVTLNYYDIS